MFLLPRLSPGRPSEHSRRISGIPIDLGVGLCPIRDAAEADSSYGQFCSELITLRDYKNDSLEETQKGRNLSFTTAKEKYENQHER